MVLFLKQVHLQLPSRLYSHENTHDQPHKQCVAYREYSVSAVPQPPPHPHPPFRPLSTTRPAPFSSTRRCLTSADDKKRQEMLEALERDRQSALELQSQSEGSAAAVGEEDADGALAAAAHIAVPPDFSYAPVPKQAEMYVPAKTAEGLEEVGGLEDWWDQEGHWGAVDELKVFSVPRNEGAKVTDPNVLEVLLRQAVVEALVVQGKRGEEMLRGRWAGLEKENTLKAAGVELQVSESGDITLTGDLGAILSGLETSAQESEAAAVEAPPAEAAEQEAVEEPVQEEVLTAEEAREISRSWDRSWKQIPLTNPTLKFAVHKRLYQLSGHYIPDAKLAPTRTAQHILTLVSKPPKARKLIEVIQQQHQRAQMDASKADNDLLNLPNVKVYSRRVTPIDKEVWVGRWKIIEDELRKRDLPVTGTGKYGKAKEKAWLMGKP
ncbi:hypothetical protein jhhlp_002724 [Lomentospora prolificans]|uniref:Large ribosomal subunit protein mL50 n=1 Tax=Lomentospora prolificans TaxID=41688 RepID=A0A2N3NEW0_9PEZI|nr:hypothetical protein jhhlp_002724 [Lomentospora prolificans]